MKQKNFCEEVRSYLWDERTYPMTGENCGQQEAAHMVIESRVQSALTLEDAMIS